MYKKRFIVYISLLLAIFISLTSFIGNQSVKESKAQGFTNTNFPHIKTWLAMIGTADEIDSSEAQWLASRFDVTFGSIGSLQVWEQTNPNVKLCAGRPLEYFWNADHNKIKQWGIDNNRDYEEVYLHARENTFVSGTGMSVQGWNPDDDQGQCGGIAGDGVNDIINNSDGTCCETETCPPSDPIRSAETIEESRIGVPDLRSQEWLDWAIYNVINCGEWGLPYCRVDCIWEDNVIYLPFGQFSLDKTFEYWDIPEDYNHPHITDRFVAGANLRDSVSAQLGKEIFALPNVGATSDHIEPFKTLSTQYFNNILIEWWLYGAAKVNEGPNYEGTYQRQIVNIIDLTLDSNERRFLQTPVYLSQATDQRKLLSLASFYLVNNPNVYYQFSIYPSSEYPIDEMKKDHPSKFKWFNAIGYDIGQPKKNPSGQADYKGNLNTTQHYEWAQGQDPSNSSNTYHVLARHYSNALILTKYKPKDSSSTGIDSATTHQLNGTFQPLNVDGTLGNTVSEVTLTNNEAAIFIPVDETPPAAIDDLEAS